jgi:hypothetical protein
MKEHEPDPAFVENLEWQLRTALRRRERFARPASGRALRMLHTAVLMLVCVAGGAGAAVGAEHLRQSQARELLLARNALQVEAALQLLELEQHRLERAEALRAEGLVAQGAVGDAWLALDSAVCDLDLLRLAGEEIHASGRPPQRALAAPLVRGRDFVSEALRLERKRVGLRLQGKAEELARTEELAAAGMITEAEGREAREGLEELERELRRIDERLELRATYLAGDRDAMTTELLDLRYAARTRLEQVEGRIEGLRARYERVEALVRAGLAGEQERLEAESALRRAEGELEMHRIELRLVDERL